MHLTPVLQDPPRPRDDFVLPHRRVPLHSAPLRIVVEMPRHFAPAVKSAIEEISNSIGQRLEGVQKFSKEDALTRAAAGLGILRGAFHQQVPKGDRDYA